MLFKDHGVCFSRICEEVHVSGDAVAKAHSGSSKKFRYAAEYHEIGEFLCKRNGCDGTDIRGEFYVSFVDHYEDIFFRTEAYELAEIFL